MNKTQRKGRPVNFYDGDVDHECALLAALGMSNRMISRETGLSNGQISYRLKISSIKRMEYRDGVSSFAKAAMKSVRSVAENELIRHLRKHL